MCFFNSTTQRVITAVGIKCTYNALSVTNSDTLFKEDFSISQVKKRFSDLQARCEDNCLVLSYRCNDQGEFYSVGIGGADEMLPEPVQRCGCWVFKSVSLMLVSPQKPRSTAYWK